ncbi:hypothetical protein SAMN04487820_10745 [Actinopolyspora mzabensis]|uniref:Uncharacterized protein n=1 Tax=Actinopolyspora mzabensis TaxID=995066 RepID=A0A1G9BAM6_ACTMZ|nr:hypothetical protein [Actinopolyspora mzabensis]SDK36557.1 hypothetical protein SAMN04487820_10745 [Actinopolyspora mzabensis]
MRKRAVSAALRAGFTSRTPLLVTLVFTFLFSTLAGVSGGIQTATARDVLRADGAQRIVISSLDSKGTFGILDDERMELIRSVPGVEYAVADYPSAIRTPVGTDMPRLSLATHSWGSYVPPPITGGSVAEGVLPGQVVLPARSQGVDFTRYLGRTLSFSYRDELPAPPGSETGIEEAAEDSRPIRTNSAIIELEVIATYDHRWHADGPQTAYLAPATAVRVAAAAEGKTVSQLRESSNAERVGVLVDEPHEPRAVASRLRDMGLGAFRMPLREQKMIATVHTWRYIALGGLLGGAALFGVLTARRNGSRERFEHRTTTAAAVALAGAVPATALGIPGALVLRAPMEEFLGLRIDHWMLLPSPVWVLLGILLPALAAAAGVVGERASGRFRRG